MKCIYHPDKDAIAQCSRCRSPLCEQCAIPEGNESFICSRCAALKAGQDAHEASKDACEEIDECMGQKEIKRQIQEARKRRKSRIWLVSQWIILLACLSIIAIQVPKLISSFEEEKPIRYGTYSTDAKTDQCIKNLWHISRLIQEGRLPGKDIVCPVSKMPYVINTVDGNIVIHCPNPEKHGFKEIRVSKKNPNPELRK